MKRVFGLLLAAALAVTGLTACMSDESSSSRGERRAAALVTAGTPGSMLQLTIDGLTPAGKAIDVLAYSWGVEDGQPIAFDDLKVTKTMDATSPLLFEGAALGTRFRNAILKLWVPDQSGQNVHYATFTLENVVVKSVRTTGHRNAGSRGDLEEVSLAYGRILQVVLRDPNGPIPPVQFGWDLVNGRQYQP